MNDRISVLDCTIRDGGLGLKAEYDSVKGNNGYSLGDIGEMTKCLTNANIDIIELGTLGNVVEDIPQFGIFSSMEDISKLIPTSRKRKQMYSVFFQTPDYDIDSVPDYNETLCELIRFSLRYSELDNSLEYCKKLAEKGYKISIQPIVTVRYTVEDIEKIIDVANEIEAYSVYIVDSYGSMTKDCITEFYKLLDSKLDSNIKIGIHAHNNMEMAFSNSIGIIQNSSTRKIIIDTCCMGLGQGAGNLQTEVMVDWLNREMHGQYNFKEILKCCEYVSKVYEEKSFGYSLSYMIPARYNVAYKYGKVLREKYHFNYVDIDECLSSLDIDIKYRYSDDSINKVVENFSRKTIR